MPKRTRNYETGLHERLKDPSYAIEYLQAALEDDEEGGDAVFLLALRDVAQANHMSYVAEAAGLNRESLYKMLSRRGNPGINSLKAVLNAVGLRLSVEVAAVTVLDADTAQQVATWEPATWEPMHFPHGSFVYDTLQASPQTCEAGLEFLGKPPPEPGSSQCSCRDFLVLIVLRANDNLTKSRRDPSRDLTSGQVRIEASRSSPVSRLPRRNGGQIDGSVFPQGVPQFCS